MRNVVVRNVDVRNGNVGIHICAKCAGEMASTHTTTRHPHIPRSKQHGYTSIALSYGAAIKHAGPPGQLLFQFHLDLRYFGLLQFVFLNTQHICLV